MRFARAAMYVAGWELFWWAWRVRARRRLYAAASARAKLLGRPLVVAGDPDAGPTRGPGCGDICVDLTGCPACPKGIAADVTKRIPLAADSAVVFVSCVLEYVADFPAARRELLRIAGAPENLFVVRVQPWTLTAHLFPGARRTFGARDLPAGATLAGAPRA